MTDLAVSQTLTLTQTSQSVSGNYSYVTFKWTSTQSGSSWNGYTRTAYYYVSKNGGSETKYSVSYTLPKSSTKTIVSKSIQVAHKTDGTGSIKVRTYMDTDISAGVIEKSKSLTLTTIPRATTPTASASSVNMGSKVTINTPRASSSFTHDLAYSFEGASYVSITTGVGTSYSWTVPDLASKIPDDTSGSLKIRCITKSGSTTIGTKYVTITAKVPSSVVPTVSSVTLAEAVTTVADLFGVYVQGKSKVKATITAAGAKGSTIESYESTLLGTVYKGSSWTSGLLTSYGTLTVKTRVKDSRGRWSSYKETTLTVVQYYAPKVTSLKAHRCDANGAAQDDGIYAYIEYAYQVAPVSDKNTAAMKIDFKRSTAEEYGSADVFLTGTALSADTGQKMDSPTLSTDYQYDIRLTVTDAFGSTATYVTTLPSGAVILDIRANGLGIAFGKTSEQDGVEFGWDIVDHIKGFGSMSGFYKTHDGLLIEWGTVTITPTAAGTPTTVVVTFPQAFEETPAVVVTPVTSVPQNAHFGVQRATSIVGDPKEAVAVTLTRDGTTSTGAYWLAVGKGAA